MGPSVPACTILLVGDEMEMAAEIKLELERNGYLVRSVSTAEVADVVHADSAALLILDRVLSLRTLEELRKQGNKIPVLVISALSSADEIAQGLRAGADDYLVKPFEMAELVARVEALLRRLGDVHTTKLSFDDLEIDLIAQTASRGGNKIGLLPRELKLLEYFLRRPGQVINLRKKIDDYGQPSRIANVRGMGYMLCRRRT